MPRSKGSGHGTSPAFPDHSRADVIGKSKAELSRTAAGSTRATQPNNLVCGRSLGPRPRCLMRILGEAPRGWAHSNLRLAAHRTRRCTIRLGVPTARQHGSVVLKEPECLPQPEGSCGSQHEAFGDFTEPGITPQPNHVLDNVAQSEVPFGLTISREALRAGDRAKTEGLKPSSRPELARPAGNGGDDDPAAHNRPTDQPRGGL